MAEGRHSKGRLPKGRSDFDFGSQQVIAEEVLKVLRRIDEIPTFTPSKFGHIFDEDALDGIRSQLGEAAACGQPRKLYQFIYGTIVTDCVARSTEERCK